jgi:hypothetical protein
VWDLQHHFITKQKPQNLCKKFEQPKFNKIKNKNTTTNKNDNDNDNDDVEKRKT